MIFQQSEDLKLGSFHHHISVEEVAGEEHLVEDTPLMPLVPHVHWVPAFRLGPVPRGCKSAASPSKEKSCAMGRCAHALERQHDPARSQSSDSSPVELNLPCRKCRQLRGRRHDDAGIPNRPRAAGSMASLGRGSGRACPRSRLLRLPFDAFVPLALRAFSTTGDSTAASSMLLPAKAPACRSDRSGLSL